MPSTTVEIRGKDRTKTAFSSVSASLKKMKGAVGSLQGSIVGLVGAGALGALVTNLANTADRLGKTSARLGIATDDLQKFRFAAEQSGMDVSTFDMALQRFTRRVAEAGEGTGVAKDALESMGIAIRDSNGNLKSNSDLLREVADAFAQTGSQSERVKLAFKLFDSEGVKMVNMLQQGSGAIDAMGDQLESVSGIIDERAIKASETFNDRLNILQKSAGSFMTRLVELVNKGMDPFFESTEKLADKVKEQSQAKLEAIKIENAYVAKVMEEIPAIASLETKLDALNLKQRELNIKRILSIDLLERLERANKIALRTDTESINANNLQIKGLTAYVSKLIEANNAIELEKNNLKELNQLYLMNVASIETFYRTRDRMTEDDVEKHRQAIEQKQLMDVANVEYQLQLNEQIEADKKAKAEAEMALTKQVAMSSLSTIQSLSAGVANESQGLFELNKAVSIANVYINAAEASSKALAQLGAYGPPVAGAIYALAIANIAKIASQKFPKREYGGDVVANKPYIVGEKGPEVFTPGRTGTITPNNQLGNQTNVNFSINAVDARNFDQLLVARRGLIIGMINQAMNRSGQSGII